MDKTIKTIAYSPETIAKETKAIGYMLSAMVFSLLVLSPLAGYAATDAGEAGTQDKVPTALTRSIEASKAVSSRALSSKARAANKKPALAAKTGKTSQMKLAGKEIVPGSLSSTGKPNEKKEPMTIKTVSGEISSKSSRGIGLVYGMDKKANSELEMWLPFSEGFGVQGYKTAAEISLGDSVSVAYEETQEGGFKRAAKSVKLVKKAPEEEPASEGGATP